MFLHPSKIWRLNVGMVDFGKVDVYVEEPKRKLDVVLLRPDPS